MNAANIYIQSGPRPASSFFLSPSPMADLYHICRIYFFCILTDSRLCVFGAHMGSRGHLSKIPGPAPGLFIFLFLSVSDFSPLLEKSFTAKKN